MNFKRLEDLRIDHDLTQKQIGEILVCDRIVYGRYERGQREIPVWALIKLAQHYKVSVDYILGLTDDPKPYPRAKHAR